MCAIAADDTGIHFLEDDGREITVVGWGEIVAIYSVWDEMADGQRFLAIYVDHFTGVDFEFDNHETGYEQVMMLMEQQLIGFSRARAEVAGSWEQEPHEVWRRDLSIQPLQPLPLPEPVSREPTQEELRLMESARLATIETCERVLGRPLTAAELLCVDVRWANGEIAGDIGSPLSDALLRRQGGSQDRTGGR